MKIGSFGLVLLLTSSWLNYFSPFLFLREFGVRPLNILTLIIFFTFIIMNVTFSQSMRFSGKKHVLNVINFGISLLLVCVVTFPINILLGNLNIRSYALQLLCFFAYFPISIILFFIFTNYSIERIRSAYFASAILLIIFWYLDFFFPNILGTELFQSGEKFRTTGLFHEPTAVGFFAGFFICSLVFYEPTATKWIRLTLISLVVFIAFVSASKSFFVFCFLHVILFEIWNIRTREIISIFILSSIVLAYAVFFQLQEEFDVAKNLSVAFRIGSNFLAGLLIKDLHFFGGIGFGQFGNYIDGLLAPSFLHASKEYLSVMSGLNNTRVSTYNLLLRLWLELTVLAPILLLFVLYKGRKFLMRKVDRQWWFFKPLFSVLVATLLSADSYTLPIYPIFTALILLYYTEVHKNDQRNRS